MIESDRLRQESSGRGSSRFLFAVCWLAVLAGLIGGMIFPGHAHDLGLAQIYVTAESDQM
jgi:hypothetical protein